MTSKAQIGFLSLLMVWMVPMSSQAQPEPSEDGLGGKILALDQNQRAPFRGMLILERDLVKWRLKIEHLDLQLKLREEFNGKVQKIREDVCTEKLDLYKKLGIQKDKLWVERTGELRDEILETRTRLIKSQRYGFWKHPALWFSVGLVTGVLSFVLLGTDK